MTGPRFVEFFAGIGGFRLGFERAGFQCAWASEIDPFARSVYAARFGHAPENDDVTKLCPWELPKADLWVGGSPCQDFSVAGLRAGASEEGGTRSGLIWTWLRLLEGRRPEWLLIENVPGFLSSHGGEDFRAVLQALDDLGYRVAWRVLDARFFGVPQRRRRVFLLARRAGNGAHPAEVLLEPEGVLGDSAPGSSEGKGPSRGARARSARGRRSGEQGIDVAGTLGGGSGKRGWCDDLDRAPFVPAQAGQAAQEDTFIGQCHGGDIGRMGTIRAGHGDVQSGVPFLAATLPPGEPAVYQCHGSNVGPMGTVRAGNGNESGGVPFVAHAIPKDSGADVSDVAPTLRAMGVKESHLMGVRRLTPRETERLQGFPDDFTLIELPDRPLKCSACAGKGYRMEPRVGRGPKVRESCVTCSGHGSFDKTKWSPDSLRYRAVGNAVAVPVIEWIGRRLTAVISAEQAAPRRRRRKS